jgi:hypothetical protein
MPGMRYPGFDGGWTLSRSRRRFVGGVSLAAMRWVVEVEAADAVQGVFAAAHGRDSVVTDADRLLATARRSCRELNPGANSEEANAISTGMNFPGGPLRVDVPRR